MEDQFQHLFKGLILFALFGVLILTIVVSTGAEYGKDTSEFTGGVFNLSGFNQSIQGFQGSMEAKQDVFSKGSVWGIAGVVVSGIFEIATGIVGMILTPFSFMINILVSVLHIPTFVAYVMMGLLIFTIILAIWNLIKVGN